MIANPTEVRDLMWTGYQKPALMLHTAPQRGARPRALRRRLPRLHPHLGLPASHAGRLLPPHARRVAAWSSTGSGATGCTPPRGSTRRWSRWSTDTSGGASVYVVEPRHDGHAGRAARHLRRRHRRDGAAAGGDVEPRPALHLPPAHARSACGRWRWTRGACCRTRTGATTHGSDASPALALVRPPPRGARRRGGRRGGRAERRAAPRAGRARSRRRLLARRARRLPGPARAGGDADGAPDPHPAATTNRSGSAAATRSPATSRAPSCPSRPTSSSSARASPAPPPRTT